MPEVLIALIGLAGSAVGAEILIRRVYVGGIYKSVLA